MSSSYTLFAYWGPRREGPPALAERLLRMSKGLAATHPAFRDWFYVTDKKLGGKMVQPVALLTRDDLVALVAANAKRGDDGTPEPERGYILAGGNELRRSPTAVKMSIMAGKPTIANYFINNVSIRTEPLEESNASLITLPVLKPAMLAIAAAWDVTWCAVYPSDLLDLCPTPEPPRPLFNLAWMTYLSPRLAPMVTPPASAVVEHPPGGGLQMIATTERFHTADPRHLAVARDIEAALAPINALPWPPDAAPA